MQSARPRVQRHDDFFKGGIPGAFAESVDRTLHLPGAGFDPRERVGDGAAGGAGANDDRVGALGQQLEIEVHDVRAGCAAACRVGVIRQAATIAAAVIVPTSANVSW